MIGRVDDHEHVVLTLVDEHVVERVAVLTAEQPVADGVRRDAPDVGGQHAVQRLHPVGAGEAEAPHVAEVEQPHPLPHAADLVEDGTVLDRHVPAAELDHARAEALVEIVERGVSHGSGGAPPLFARCPAGGASRACCDPVRFA